MDGTKKLLYLIIFVLLSYIFYLLNLLGKYPETYYSSINNDFISNSKVKCVVSGCSGQLCLNEVNAKSSGITTCEYKSYFSCYKKTKCEVQANGTCGWTKNTEYTKCMQSFLPTLK